MLSNRFFRAFLILPILASFAALLGAGGDPNLIFDLVDGEREIWG